MWASGALRLVAAESREISGTMRIARRPVCPPYPRQEVRCGLLVAFRFFVVGGGACELLWPVLSVEKSKFFKKQAHFFFQT
jgi:hypothetical protein